MPCDSEIPVAVPSVDDPESEEETEIIRAGLDALHVLRHITFEHWLKVARALDIGRRRAMAETGANDIRDKRYQKAFSRWLAGHSEFSSSIPGPTRMWLLRCHEHREAIIAWRAVKGDGELMKYNFPETVFKRWAKDTQPELLTELQQQQRPRPPVLSPQNETWRSISMSGGRIRDSARVFCAQFEPHEVVRFAKEIALLVPLEAVPEIINVFQIRLEPDEENARTELVAEELVALTPEERVARLTELDLNARYALLNSLPYEQRAQWEEELSPSDGSEPAEEDPA